MKSDRDIELALRRQVAHAAGVTSTAVATFSRSFIAPTEAMAGGVGAFSGLAGAVTWGIINPLFASVVLDACGFGGVGLASALIARLLTSRKRRANEDQRRTELAFQAQQLEMQLQVLDRLPNWVDKSQLDSFTAEVLETIRPGRLTKASTTTINAPPDLPQIGRTPPA